MLATSALRAALADFIQVVISMLLTLAECQLLRKRPLSLPNVLALSGVRCTVRMDVYIARDVNLRMLLSEHGSLAEIGRLADTDPNYLTQILSPNISRRMGAALARKIERKLGKPTGWMDESPATRERGALSDETIAMAQAIEAMPSDQRAAFRALFDSLADRRHIK